MAQESDSAQPRQMEVNIHHAKTHLSRLISAAESGEEVIIARND